MPAIRIAVFVLALLFCFNGMTVTAESAKGVAWLGFPILDRSKQPPEINLAKGQSLGSAFLLQLRRQAVLLAAREELGALTRDAFLDEPAPDDSVRIADIEQFPSADVKYIDHRQFLNELEKRSRNEFVAEWKKPGLKKSEPLQPAENGDLDAERTEIETLLTEWALIPQFEAVRRTHDAVRRYGESLPLLTLLVRGYTQLQMLTNIAPRDTHRVFQARAMLYAQRAVAKFGETPETLLLRAAAWSLNNFHRLAREEFAAIPPDEWEKTDAWIPLAKAYCEFDFKAIAAMAETVDPKAQRPLAKLLYFFLLAYAHETKTLARPFGEKAIADLPDCARLYIETSRINNFDMIHAPDGSPFHEHLARRIAPAVRKMRNLPEEVSDKAKQLDGTVRKPFSGLFSLFGGGPARQIFPVEQYFIDYAALLKSLSETQNDSNDPSLSVLALLLRDDDLHIVQELASYLQGHNGHPETYIMPSLPVIDEHPAVEYLGLACRDRALSSSFWQRLVTKSIPHNMFSQHCSGFSKNVFDSNLNGRLYSSYYFACLFADRENVHDMVQYHYIARYEVPARTYMFTLDVLQSLCPKNPYTLCVRLARGRNVNEEEAELIGKEFADFPGIGDELAEYYTKHNLPEKIEALIGGDYKSKLTPLLRDMLRDLYLGQNEPGKAIEIIKKFLETPQAQEKLISQRLLGEIGLILLQQGKIKEAEAYFVPGMQTHAGWGLQRMAHYQGIIGNFDAAEQLHATTLSSYPEIGPFDFWAFRFLANRPGLQESMDEIFQRYARYKGMVGGKTTETVMKNLMSDYQVIYPCYCMDLPYPEPLGKDPLVEEFLRSGAGMTGFLAWFDAKEKKNEKKATRLLRLLRDQWFLDEKSDPFVAAQRTVSPKIQKRQNVIYAYQMLAAIIEIDQRSKTPGQLNQEEINYLLRAHFRNDLDAEAAPWLLYLIGRYYDLYGDKERAIESYRRALGFRADFNYFLRCLTVKELRKSGMTDEEYVRWSQADPQIPRQKISYSHADVFCRQHFRDYSESPSTSILAKPAPAKPPVRIELIKPTLRTPGWYKVTSIQFRGKTIPETETVVYWRVPEEKEDEEYRNWYTTGIAACADFSTLAEQRRDDRTYSLRFGNEKDGLPALAVFQHDKLTLYVSLKSEEEPDYASPNCVRVEMKKVADIPPEEPMIPIAEQTGPPVNDTLPAKLSDDETPEWMNHTRLAAATVAGLAIVVAALLSIVKKRRRPPETGPR